MALSIKRNKSKNAFIRINPKNTGTDYTLGVPGFTITLSTKRNSTKKYIANTPITTNRTIEIKSAEPHHFQAKECLTLLSKISNLIKLNILSTWLIITLIIAAITYFITTVPYIISAIFVITGSVGLLLKIYIHSIGRYPLKNAVNTEVSSNQAHRISAWRELSQVQKLWQIVGTIQTEDRKENAGVSLLYDRILLKAKYKAPFYLKSTFPILRLPLKSLTLFLLPELILLVRKSKVGAIKYSDITITAKTLRYIEFESVPKDAEIIDYTWKYVNNDGSPDKRYKDNLRLPICNYGEISLKSESGLNVVLHSSDITVIKKFELC